MAAEWEKDVSSDCAPHMEGGGTVMGYPDGVGKDSDLLSTGGLDGGKGGGGGGKDG